MNSPLTGLPQTFTILALTLCLATTPALAHTGGDDGATARSATASAPLTRVFTATPITDAARAAADAQGRTAGAAPAKKSASPAARCASNVAFAGVIGAGAGLGAGYGLLVASGGSDSYGAILKAFTAIGAVAGLVGGLIACDQ